MQVVPNHIFMNTRKKANPTKMIFQPFKYFQIIFKSYKIELQLVKYIT